MATYVYKCPQCSKTITITHSIHDTNKKINCKQCHKQMRKVLFPPRIIGEPTTVGGLADRNTKLLRKSGHCGIINNRKQEPLPNGCTRSIREIIKMSPEQQKRYIVKGK